MAISFTHDELVEKMRREGKSVLLPGGMHVANPEGLPDKAALAKGDAASESRVKRELKEEITSRMAQLAELGETYQPVNEIIAPEDLPEGDPRRQHSTVRKNADLEPQTEKEQAEADKRDELAETGGTVKGATAPVDATGEKIKPSGGAKK